MNNRIAGWRIFATGDRSLGCKTAGSGIHDVVDVVDVVDLGNLVVLYVR